jgi:uncharacterized membrane protein
MADLKTPLDQLATLPPLPEKSWLERSFHALMFEVGGVLLATPLAAWLMNSSITHVGGLAILLASIAMTWNAVFNFIFERFERRYGWQRTPTIRVLHALLFEGGLVVMVLPLTMWWMDLTFWQALALDLGFFVFFLPYTYVYNWVYDVLRVRYFRRYAVS